MPVDTMKPLIPRTQAPTKPPKPHRTVRIFNVGGVLYPEGYEGLTFVSYAKLSHWAVDNSVNVQFID